MNRSDALFTEFDFGVLDDPTFKEDAVREDIISPVLRKLGYAATGPKRMVRSKTLSNPFLRVGAKGLKVTVPDYTLWSDDRAVLVLEAKGPQEDIFDLDHVGQAYSYAVHPEVRCEHFALCNGRDLALFHIHKPEPVFNIATKAIDERWAELEKEFAPELLLKPIYRNYKPDLGLHIQRSRAVEDGEVFGMPGVRIETLARLATGSYTAGASLRFEGASYLANFDFGARLLQKTLVCLAAPLRERLENALDRAPCYASVDFMIEADFLVRLGTPTEGEAGKFDPLIPFVVLDVLAARLNRTEAPERDNSNIFSLRAAFEKLRSG